MFGAHGGGNGGSCLGNHAYSIATHPSNQLNGKGVARGRPR